MEYFNIKGNDPYTYTYKQIFKKIHRDMLNETNIPVLP